MKALFLAILLGNLLFFGWYRWHAPAGARMGAAVPVPASTLELAQAAPPSKTRGTSFSGESGEVPRCLSVGPFHALPESSEASVSLRERGYAPRTRVDEGDIWGGLWVYLEDLPSRAEAQRVMGVLKQNGIDDAYIMPSGEQTLDISLGVFSEIPRAQRRAAEARKLGFAPTLAERTRKGSVYWLDVDLKPGSPAIDPADLHRKDRDSGAIVRLEVKPCPAAAG